MLMVNQLIGFGAGDAPVAATVSFVDSLQGVVTKSVSYGASAAVRKLVYICGKDATTDTVTVTIDGNSMTKIGSIISNGTDGLTSFYYDINAGATSGTLTVTNGGTSGRHFGALFAVYGAAAGAPATSISDTANNNPTGSLTTVSNGAACAAYYARTPSGFTTTWTGLTEDLESAYLSSAFDGSAASANISSGSSLTVTATLSGTPTRKPCFHAHAFSPA